MTRLIVTIMQIKGQMIDNVVKLEERQTKLDDLDDKACRLMKLGWMYRRTFIVAEFIISAY